MDSPDFKRYLRITAPIVLVLLLLVLLLIYLLLRDTNDRVDRGGEPRGNIEPVLTIRGPGEGDAPDFNRPLGAAFGPDGRIYVADTGNNRICVFSGAGRFLFEFGGFGVAKPLPGIDPTWNQGELNFPAAVTVAPDGTIYVADFRNDQVQAFDTRGGFLRRFPDPGKPVGKGSSGQDGTGIAVTGLAADGGVVFATDEYQVFAFTAAGELIRQFGRPGAGPGELDRPNGLEVSEDGTLYVADSNNARVVAYRADGTVQWIAGGRDSENQRLFQLPRDVALTESGTIVVLDAFDFELVELDHDGTELARYGERGVEPAQFNFPNSVDARGELLLIADKENDRVQVVRLVRVEPF